MSSPSLRRAGVFLAISLIGAACGKDPVAPPEKQVSLIEIAPKNALLYAVGQTRQFTTTLTTEAGTDGEGIPITYDVRDKTLLQVSATGLATVLKKGGTTYVVATAGGKSDSALVQLPSSTCTTTAPTTMTVGQVVTDIGDAGFCAAASNGEYAVIVHNTSFAGSGFTSLEVTPIGVSTPPGTSALYAKTFVPPAPGMTTRQWKRDAAAEMRFRRQEAIVAAPFAATAHSWYANRKRASLTVAAPAVGDIMSVNVNLQSSCTNPTTINARVAAVSSTAIVVTDPDNPPVNAYSDEELAGFAAAFDQFINPLDTTQFGAPTDLDNNQRVIIVFTKAVNALTPPGADYYIGGLTYTRDLLPRTAASGTNGVDFCTAGNQAEMFYMLVPDTLGVVNGNDFTKKFVNSVTEATLAHEYQHLINFARRRYLNGATPQAPAELWLNEGLSHMAEELLYYARSGRTPRTNIGASSLTNADSSFTHWLYYLSGDFLNYDEYVFAPASTSPFETGDDLATRGASWSFLRYLADQRPADGKVWYNLVNAGLSGIANLEAGFGLSDATLRTAFRDFVISTYTDDFVPGVAAKYTQPSWNMRSIYPRVNELLSLTTYVWPLNGTGLSDTQMRTATLQAGAFRVYRFTGLAGTNSLIKVKGSGGATLPSGITISVVRTQ